MTDIFFRMGEIGVNTCGLLPLISPFPILFLYFFDADATKQKLRWSTLYYSEQPTTH